MARQRKLSNSSSTSSFPERNQELESMYDYLAKVILVGPSGTGKSCLLHRFVKDECTLMLLPDLIDDTSFALLKECGLTNSRIAGRVLSSQTIGVEFSSKIVKVGTGPRRKRIKLQLWDTAGTERFRSVSRSYYRGAAGAILIYDVSSYSSFTALPTFLMDARALASPNLTVILAGNKTDLTDDPVPDGSSFDDSQRPSPTPLSTSSKQSSFPFDSGGGSVRSMAGLNVGTRMTATFAPQGREVSAKEALEWATKSNIPVAVEVSALSGQNVEELFNRLARIILTKIELGEIDPDDPQSGIQYGDGGAWAFGTSDGGSVRSAMTVDDNNVQLHRRRNRRAHGTNPWMDGVREWEDVFGVSGSNRRQGRGCC